MKITKRDYSVYAISFITMALIIVLYSNGSIIKSLIFCLVYTLIFGTLVNLLIRLFISLDMYIKQGKK